MSDVMHDRDFWSAMEFRICAEMPHVESSVRGMWCDGLDPRQRDEAGRIHGLAWFGNSGQEEWSFQLEALNGKIGIAAAGDFVPADDEHGWLVVDPHSRRLLIQCWLQPVPLSTYFVQFEATPRRDNVEFAYAAGAFVNCWVRARTLDFAVEIARAESADGWIIGPVEEAYAIERHECRTEDGRGYFDQAQTDGVVIVFHTYSIDESEND